MFRFQFNLAIGVKFNDWSASEVMAFFVIIVSFDCCFPYIINIVVLFRSCLDDCLGWIGDGKVHINMTKSVWIVWHLIIFYVKSRAPCFWVSISHSFACAVNVWNLIRRELFSVPVQSQSQRSLYTFTFSWLTTRIDWGWCGWLCCFHFSGRIPCFVPWISPAQNFSQAVG